MANSKSKTKASSSKSSSKKKKNEEIKIDVLKHFLNPEMRILKEEEVEKVLKKFGVKKEQLPKFLSNDPAVKALGAKKGDVVEIKREDRTGKYLYYRVVV